MPHAFTGSCHCGNIELRFETVTAPESLAVRACNCSFCSRHGACTTSDPEGRVRIVVHDPAALIRYRFALETADYLVCGRCGIYVAAVARTGGRWHATINVNALDDAERFSRAPEPVDYDGESEEGRRERRVARWTPVEGGVG